MQLITTRDFVPILIGSLALDLVYTRGGTVALWLDERGRVLWRARAGRA
jgi:hypothetical protein